VLWFTLWWYALSRWTPCGTGANRYPISPRRLVDMVLTGLTNRQIGERFSVSARAVEFHLTRIYQKLGISRRAQIAAAMVDDHAGALADFLDCGDRLLSRGVVNPAVRPWRSQAALACLGMGRRDEARRLAGLDVGGSRRATVLAGMSR